MVGISCPPLEAAACTPLMVIMMFVAHLAHVTSAQNLPSLGNRAVNDSNSWVIAGNFIVVGGTLVSTGEPFYNGIVSNGMSRTSRFSDLSSSPLPYAATGPAFSVADVVRGRILVCYSGSTNVSTQIRRSCLGITAPAASTFASRAQTGAAAASEQWAECFPVNNIPRHSALVVASSTYLYVIGGTDVSTGALVQSYEQAPLADACTTTVAWTTVEFTTNYIINASSGVISSPVTNAIPIVATAAFSRSLYATVIGGTPIGPHIAAFPIDDQGVINFVNTIFSYATGSTSAPNPGGQATAIWDLVIFSQYQGLGTVAQVHGTLYYVNATTFPASISHLSNRPAAVGYLGAYFSLVDGTNDVLIVPAFPSLPPIEITSPAQITVGDTVIVSTTAGNEDFVQNTGLEVIMAPTQACDSVWAACAKSSSDSSSSAGSTTWACDTVGTTVPEGETQLLYLCFGVAPSAETNTVLSTTGGCLASGYTLQTVWGDQSNTNCYSRNLALTERSWSLATDQVIEVFAVTTTTTTTTAVPTTTMTTTTTSTTTSTTTTIAPTTTTTTTTTTTEMPTSTATSSTSTTEAPTSTTTTTTTTAPTSTTTSASPSTSTATPTTSTSTTPLTTTSTTTVEPTTTSTTTTTTTTTPPNTTTIAPTTTTTAAPPPTKTTTAAPPPTNATTPGPPPTNGTTPGPPPTNATTAGPAPTNGTIPAPLPAPSGLSTYVICLIAIGGLIGIAAVAVAIHRCCGCGAADGSADDNGDEGFGQYRLKSKIAHGGQGTVYLMERRHDLHEYALKFIVCHDNKDRMAALQEFEIMQSCKGHSNMIELVDMFMNWEEEDEVKVAPPAPLREKLSSEEMEADLLIQRGNVSDTAALASLTHSPRFVAIVTEYYPAGSLQKYIISRTTPIPETVVWSCVFQVANLLHFLHSRSPPVIHQDIKPENVLVDLKTNRLVVTDFGLAARLTPHYKSKSNGTRFYMSPEANSGTPNEKTDIWALGCMLYVLCNRTAAVEKGEKCFFLDVRKDEFEDELMHELEELGYSTALADLCVNMLKLKTDDRLCAEEVIMCCQRECSGLDKATF